MKTLTIDIDFHIHSVFSDGILKPKNIIEMADKMDMISITDHDNCSFHINYNHPNIIKGTELSCDDGSFNCHLLVYTRNFNAEFKNNVEKYRIRRNVIYQRALLKTCKILSVDIQPSEIYPFGCFSPENIEKIITPFGYTFFSFIQEHNIFDIGFYSLEETIKLFNNPDNILVLAHPRVNQPALSYVRKGMIHGVEYNLRRNNYNAIEEFIDSHLVTIGSDLHKLSHKNLLTIDVDIYSELINPIVEFKNFFK